jgi:hypothetical protein
MTQAILPEKYEIVAVNWLLDPTLMIGKMINQSQYFISLIRKVNEGDLTILNQLMNTFVGSDQILREMREILKLIVSIELFQTAKYFLMDRKMENTNNIQKMWRGEVGTTDHLMISLMYEPQGSML